jgi:ligand-binding SRPBCC domain-containing protein
MSELFVHRSRMPAPAEEVYRFYARPDALERLTPPWESTRIVAHGGGIEEPGSRVTLLVSLGPFSRKWVAEHTECEPGRMFHDRMISGPFRRWEHTHLFQPDGRRASWLEDRVEYELPLGSIGGFLFGAYARRRIEKLFEWRHRVTAEAFAERSSPAAGGGLSSSSAR